MDHVMLPGSSQEQSMLPKLETLVGRSLIEAGGAQLGAALWKKVIESAASVQAAVETYLLLITTLAPLELVASTVQPLPDIDEGIWQHECMRVFINGLNRLVVHLSSVCTAQTCPKMTATSEWLFLCACHKTPQECPAVDYAFHTLDGAATVLHSTKFFAERKDPPAALFANMIRRLYRIFAHAWHHHNEAFMAFESRNKLCERFVRFSLHFNLLQKEILMPYPEIR
ncbi:MOB kinase activator-like 4 [Diplonema papillatum]|nr:MOB kinase activator-like 4 [Diplonema papillatum]